MIDMYVTSAYCISQLSHHCDRTPDENSLREEELVVAHSLTVMTVRHGMKVMDGGRNLKQLVTF